MTESWLLMIRFVARVAPVVLMAFPIYVYRAHWPGLNDALEWRQHTYETRSLAERLVRDVGCPPDPEKLATDLNAFERLIADNPVQVAHVHAIREAMGKGDARALARLADAAVAEEERLLPIRLEKVQVKLDETRRLADRIFLFGMAIVVFQAFLEFFLRATEPVNRFFHPGSPPPGGRR